MTIELWFGQEFDTSHERRALNIFLTEMVERYDESEQLYLILANYYIEGRQVDLTVLKRDAIIIIEMKECAEPIKAVENGDWLILQANVKLGTGTQNPFAQAKDYRFRWMDLLIKKLCGFAK
ncbi:nuclease-related domain-containing protein [Thermodesulfobacteriota bacterium]